ncbi:50S ribosomal protein L18 [Hathewaya histolytica]|uniref:Large ribosomal subunit protein uL18 n=1 Tax=Hathewaya histolytica TaxID=1498 RepID=A0A4U9RRT2_HATHI|nr:50S ribosomal protein L18 [Hathewaya histolytica]VTQ95002.1 ribosomal protein L18, bacterial type [Hathewaya histolytica]
MSNKNERVAARIRRHKRVRSKVSGTTERPRLCVFRSAKNIYAQIIDDAAGTTIVSASSLDKDFTLKVGSNKEAARLIGEIIGKKAIENGIEEVVFDRGGYIYHGRVQELAEGAREAGLKF